MDQRVHAILGNFDGYLRETHAERNSPMARSKRTSIRFRGRDEEVLETFRVSGRSYYALERLSGRGAFRVFDPHAAPGGDYRVLYRLPAAEITPQRMEILRRLSGPAANRNFAHLICCTRRGNDLFVVLSWVWGTSLRTYLRAVRHHETPRPSPSEVVRLIRGLAHGIRHFHRRTHILHGDISPANIVITSGTKQLVLIDFGSAWPVEQTSIKEPGDGVTQPYAAPERLTKSAPQDFRSDIFSLSVAAYELLTLEVPFDGLGGLAGLPNMSGHARTSYRSASEFLRQSDRLPREAVERLDRCLATGLALHPDERFGTSSDWLAAWDEVHRALQKGSRLSFWEAKVLKGFDVAARILRRKKP